MGANKSSEMLPPNLMEEELLQPEFSMYNLLKENCDPRALPRLRGQKSEATLNADLRS